MSLEEMGKHWYVWEDPKEGNLKKGDKYVMEKDRSPVFSEDKGEEDVGEKERHVHCGKFS